MPRDQFETLIRSRNELGDPVLRCVHCRAEVTRPNWAISVAGEHEHTFFNPAGRVFRVLCFREAPGTSDASEPSAEFTWFHGYTWRIALCRSCNVHLGWRYEGLAAPPVFFGLINEAIE